MAVMKNKIYAPTYDEVRMAPWRSKKPPRKEVISELTRVTKNKPKPLGIKRGKWEPDMRWMLDVIRTNEFNHRFFAKDYVPEKVKDDDSEESDKVSEGIPDHFFDGLPVEQKKSKVKRLIFQPSEPERMAK